MPKNTSTNSKKQPAQSPEKLMGVFEKFLPSQIIRELYKETGKTYYVRILPPLLILWGFIFQRLNADHSLDAAWCHLSSDEVQEQFGSGKGRKQAISESTSAYCQARQRLPLEVARKILPHLSTTISNEAGENGRWRGWRVNLFDGSTMQLSANKEVREHYGTNKNQHREGHWALMRIVAGFDFYSGAVNGVAEGPYALSEHPLAAKLIRELGEGWLHIGDRFFGAYHILQVIVNSKSQANIRLNASSANRLSQGLPLHSGCDLDVTWKKAPYDKVEPDLETPDIAGRLIYVRLQKDGFRPIDLYLFTTLTDREAYPVADLVDLYGLRWRVELDLRHVKTTLDMEHLDSKSVDMIQKELLLGLAAYNLIRGLMTTAAQQANRQPCQLSLAKCWRRVMEESRSLPMQPSDADIERVLSRILQRLGRCVIAKRNHERFEPRAVWGRPQVFPKITESRNATRSEQLAKFTLES